MRRCSGSSKNLITGSFYGQAKTKRYETMRHVYELFPRLEELRKQMVGTLSGREHMAHRA